MNEFNNIHQGGMRMEMYRLKFTQISKHAHTIIVDSRAVMNKFVMGISNLLVNECRQLCCFLAWTSLTSCFMVNKLRSKSLNKMVGS